MAMLAPKSSYPAPLGASSGQQSSQYSSSASGYRNRAAVAREGNGFFTSPTESEFSEAYDAPDSIRFVNTATYNLDGHTDVTDRNWDEDRVGEWLQSINCSQYVDLFKREYLPSDAGCQRR